ncbi:MAG: hypothetical protein IPH08_04155 [Rhodocyclaceae bacterium]|nr:hypothetical protein [Rhodocyclaceae bacterium]
MFSLSLATVNLLPSLVQMFQDAVPIPAGIPEWLGLAVASGTLTEVIKRLTRLTGYKISGVAAVGLSFAVSVGVVLFDLANGGSLVTLPAGYTDGNPFTWFAAVLLTAGEVTATANGIYLFIYDKVFGSGADLPVDLAGAAILSGLPNWKVLRAFTSTAGVSYAVGQIVPKGSIGTAVINGVTYNEGQLANSGYIRPWP